MSVAFSNGMQFYYQGSRVQLFDNGLFGQDLSHLDGNSITWCVDLYLLQILCHALTIVFFFNPEDSFSVNVNRDLQPTDPKFHRTHKHRIMKRLQHVKYVH